MDEIRHGWWTAVISDITERELKFTPVSVQEVFARLPRRSVEKVRFGRAAETLAKQYIFEGALNEQFLVDARHIAVATVSHVEVFVSWNFQRIVNLDRIRALHAVNLLAGFPMMEIRSPMEVFHEEKDH